jgi:transposase
MGAMESTAIEKLLAEAKACRGSASQLVIDAMLGRLIELVTELLAARTNQRDELSKLRTIVFGSKAEGLAQAENFIGENSMSQPTNDDMADGESLPQAPVIDEGALAEALEQIKALTTEARRLSREMDLKKKPTPVSKAPETSVGQAPVQVETVRHALPEDLNVNCPQCGGAVVDQGKSHEAREVDVLLSQYIERVHLLHKGSCGCGALQFTMPAPVRGVEGRIYSPAFVAKLIYDKFVLHLPVYRQVKAMADGGLKLSRNVVNELILASYKTLAPIIERLTALNQQEAYQACDESTVTTVIDTKKQKQYLWCLVSVLAVSFKITATRSKAVAREIVGGKTKGVLTSDRLSIYWGLFDTKQESACMAHLRRKFWYCLANFPVESITVLRIIGRLYRIERLHRTSSVAERLSARTTLAIPILTELYVYLHSLNPPPQSALGKAIAYAVNHKKALCYFTTDGQVPIDNNHVEGQFRAAKLGFKNFLFTQSTLGTEAVAGMYSLIATCVLHGISPLHYLADVLARLNQGHPQAKLDELLPWNWQPSKIETPKQTAIVKRAAHSAEDIIRKTRVMQKMAELERSDYVH